MSQDGQNQGNQGNQQQSKDVKVTVGVDNEGMKTLLETQKRLEKEKEELEAKMKLIEEAKKKAEDEAKTKGDEAKDLNEKLSLIAQKEFEKKRGEVLTKVKSLIQDESRVKEISDKLTDAEQLRATEYMVQVLEQTMAKGEEAHKKVLEEEQKKLKEAEDKLAKQGGNPPPSGSAPLNSQQTAGTGSAFKGQSYSSYEAMIADLRKKEHSPNPEVAAQAKAALTELMRKWAMAVKAEFKEMREFKAEPKDQKTLAEIVQHERAKRQAMLNEEAKT